MKEKIPLTGDVKDMIIPWLFQSLNAEKKTGTIVFENDEVVKKVYFSAGDIIFASSSDSEDRLGEWLVRTGIITRQQADTTSELFKQSRKKEGEILVDQGFLTPAGLVDGIKSHVRQIIISLLNWRDGRYIFDESPLPASDIIPLLISTGNLTIEGLRKLEWKVVRKSLPPLRTIIRPADDPSLLFQDADLEPDQRAVFALIDGNKSIEDICSQTGIGDFNTLKAIYVLLALRMVEAGEIKTEEEKKFVNEVVHETISATKEEKPVAPAPARSISKEELNTAYETLGRQNYYEVLGVAHAIKTPELKKAYFTMAKLYHPDRHLKPEMSDMKEKLEALFSTIHNAYETLSDQIKRDQYDLVLAREQTKSHAEEQAKQSAAVSRNNAEDQYVEGIERLKSGDFWGADEAFQWASRLDPTNAQYVFRRAQALLRIPRRGHDAEELFKKAIKMVPRKIEYQLELGNLYERNGLKKKALSVYQNALRLDPNSEKIKQAIQKVGE